MIIETIAKCCAVISALLVLRQIYLATQTIKNNAYGELYKQQSEVHRFFIDNPELVSYFFHNKKILNGDPLEIKIKITAEMLADFFEHICLKIMILPNETKEGWAEYMKTLYNNSPAVREHFGKNPQWYTPAVKKICTGELNVLNSKAMKKSFS